MRPAGCGPGRGPPLLQLGPAQVRCEFPAAVPDRSAVLGGVAGQGDRVPGDLTRVRDAEPLAYQHPGLVQAGEELVLAARCRRSGGDLPPQRDPRGLLQAAAGGLLVLRAGSGGGPRCGRRARWSAARTAARRPGRRRGPCTVPRTGWACRRPGGPASRPDGCDHRRAARRSSGRPRLPGRRATARCGASPRARWPPIRHRTASGRRERRASSSARPAARSPARPERPAAASAARSAWRSPACRPAAAEVRGWRDDATRRRYGDRCVPRGGRDRTGNTAAARRAPRAGC